MRLIRFLCNIFKRPPILKQKYLVKEGNETIAVLTDPVMSDQFWFDFILTPISKDAALLARVYDYRRWLNQEYTFVEADNGKPVEFVVSIEFDDEAAVFDPFDALKDRPKCVRLRGPYPV